ncbi:MAG: hypothetical protein HRT72_03830 [Flavobacteriales bacterium]|nr:hypothetical protein [Flavobacteriales bacterium]
MEMIKLEKQIKNGILLFIIGLILSGVTAFPLETELKILTDLLTPSTFIHDWISATHEGVKFANDNYPFLAYGTDWLAFAHLVIAVVFIGPYLDPVRNIWVIKFGMIACVMVFPLALIAGPIRGIPLYWQLVDCSFGIFGFGLLYLIHTKIKLLETTKSSNYAY